MDRVSPPVYTQYCPRQKLMSGISAKSIISELKNSSVTHVVGLPDNGSRVLFEHLQKEPDTYVLNGGSSIIGPDGKYLLTPQFDSEETIYYEIGKLQSVLEEKMTLDISGHYNRNDVFDFKISIVTSIFSSWLRGSIMLSIMRAN